MSSPTLRLFEDQLPPQCPQVFLPAAPRAIYVRAGGVTVDDATGGRWLGEDAAEVTTSEVALTATGPTTLWRWELAARGAEARLPSAPTTSSRMILEAELDLDDRFGWLMRCDRVDFPPGGVALTHVHQGPGIRICRHGEITIETLGASKAHGPGEAWFELGHAPVLAPTTEKEETAFVRCFLLPRLLKGKSSIRYVRPEDAAAPKVQKYRVFAERFVELPVL